MAGKFVALKPGQTLILSIEGGQEIARIHALQPEPPPKQEPERCFACGDPLGSAVYRRWSQETERNERVCLLCFHDTSTGPLRFPSKYPIDTLKAGFSRGREQGIAEGREAPREQP
ncbi:hypothetical protein LCGC14_1235430 [marine sediment metagenome]|uniref:Uncharacterized protein n=1 Tax=marine sediment metagenome TaxID=412755 RepID=A0A0F9L7B7_9ZZZZ